MQTWLLGGDGGDMQPMHPLTLSRSGSWSCFLPPGFFSPLFTLIFNIYHVKDYSNMAEKGITFREKYTQGGLSSDILIKHRDQGTRGKVLSGRNWNFSRCEGPSHTVFPGPY